MRIKAYVAVVAALLVASWASIAAAVPAPVQVQSTPFQGPREVFISDKSGLTGGTSSFGVATQISTGTTSTSVTNTPIIINPCTMDGIHPIDGCTATLAVPVANVVPLLKGSANDNHPLWQSLTDAAA
jgi:hypothetical protein